MEYVILKDILIIFALSVAVIFICQRLRIPSIIGYLLTGVLAGPNGFSLIVATHEVEILAEIGVILLLFTIGIEFSLKNLVRIRNTLVVGGGIQVFLTIILFFFITRSNLLGVQDGNTIPESVFMGFLIALSSTAIVLKLLQERGEFISPHGRTSLGILIFQDIVIVPMILVLPFLAGSTGSDAAPWWHILVKVLVVIFLVFIGAKYIVPKLLFQVAKTKSRELFLLTIIVIALAVAFLTFQAGLSLALGAFLAGLIISESDYSQQAFGNVLPFLDVFTSFFFVSIGMLLNVDILFGQPILILVIAFVVIIAKSFIATLGGLALGYPLRTSLMVGLTLSQVGEFSFILSRKGQALGLISEHNYQLFLAVSVLTMAATPFIISAAPRIADLLLRLPIPDRLKSGLRSTDDHDENIKDIKDHTIVVGYGINGRNVARAAKYAKIPYEVIELNPATVKKEKALGEPIFFGDASQEVVLEHACIKDALIIVITLPNPADIRRITQVARKLNPHIHIIIRSRYIGEMQDFYKLGADEVIPEEFETSIEIFTRVLAKYLVPREEIEKLVATVRSDGYNMFRSLSVSTDNFSKLSVNVPQVNIGSQHVCKNAPIIGKSVLDVNFQENFGVNLLAVSRGKESISSPPPTYRFQDDDILFFLGSHEKLLEMNEMFKSPNEIKDC